MATFDKSGLESVCSHMYIGDGKVIIVKANGGEVRLDTPDENTITLSDGEGNEITLDEQSWTHLLLVPQAALAHVISRIRSQMTIDGGVEERSKGIWDSLWDVGGDGELREAS